MDKIPKEVSQYMSDMSKKRKNPHLAFKDKELAKEAGKKGAEKRWGKDEVPSTSETSNA